MFKEWTSHAGLDTLGDSDYINIVSDAMYTVPRAYTECILQSPSAKKHNLLQHSPLSKSTMSTMSVSAPSNTASKQEQTK